ncbi:MAG: hypothetical protein CM1200mP18_23300 [Gammaproteobacteria bacterium]|nr:MAG: hypothetical protein CM1200mP18_23300 [Gammaproteobacteria bacterium]
MMHTYPVLSHPGSITPFGLLWRIACGHGLNKWPFDGLIINKLKTVSVVATTLVLQNNAAIAGARKTWILLNDFWPANKVCICVRRTQAKCCWWSTLPVIADLPDNIAVLKLCINSIAKRGLVVLGFPSNDFLQEPRSEDKVREFCSLTYNVKFPMFEKTRVAKRHADPFYQALANQSGDYPRWNFHKYLLDRQGNVVASYGSSVKPDDESLISTIESNL